MKDLIPLLQSLVWPVFILALVYWGRRPALAILEAIRSRIESGDTLEAGSSGIKLTSARRPDSTRPRSDADLSPLSVEDSTPHGTEDKPVEEGHQKAAEGDEYKNPGFYIVHKARRDRSLDSGEYEYYRLRIFLEWDPEVDESLVTKIVYYLPEGFHPQERTVTDRDTQFELRTSAWGQFNLVADVYLRDRENPLTLERYLNF